MEPKLPDFIEAQKKAKLRLFRAAIQEDKAQQAEVARFQELVELSEQCDKPTEKPDTSTFKLVEL